jgi:hypothetical protein
VLAAIRPVPALVLGLLVLATTAGVAPPGLDEQLDEEQFLRGLVELGLREVLEHYLATHPPADEVQAARYELAVARMRLAEPGLTATERLAGIEALLDRRAALLRDHPDDPRRVHWLVDQADDLLYRLLPFDGSGLHALFGLPTEARRARAVRVATEVEALTTEAATDVERAILDLERRPGFASDVAARLERRRLDEDERRRRIPFLRAAGAVLRARLVPDAPEATRERLELALELLEPLSGPDRSPSLVRQVRLYRGLALLGLDDPAAARPELEAVGADEAAARGEQLAARLGAVDVIARGSGAEAALAELDALAADPVVRDSLFARLLVVDRRFRLRRDAALAGDASRRGPALAAAFAEYTSLLDELDLPAARRRQIVYDRLVRAASDELDAADLPPIVLVARADHRSRREEDRADAIETLRGLLDAGGLSRDDRVAALMALAAALRLDGRPLEAVATYLAVAEDHPTDDRAERAVERAAAIAWRAYGQAPGVTAVREAARWALAVLVERYPNLPTIDRWRAAAGQLAFAEGRLDDAVGLLDAVAPDAPEWLDARFTAARAARARAEAAEGAARLTRADEAAAVIERVREHLGAAVATAADETRAARLRRYLAALRVDAAALHVVRGRPEAAIEALAGIEDDPGAGAAVIAEALRLRIDAFRAAERPAEAQEAVRRYLESEPDAAHRVIVPMMSAIEREVTARLDLSRDEEAVEIARRELAPLADLLAAWLDEPGRGADLEPEPRLAAELRIADAWRLSEQWRRALPVYDRIAAARPSAIQVQLGRAECLFGLGGDRLADAMAIYRRIAAAGTGEDVRRAPIYWQAQLRMLQILDRSGRNTERIVPRIERLRREDEALGGERFRRKFEQLQNRHAAA